MQSTPVIQRISPPLIRDEEIGDPLPHPGFKNAGAIRCVTNTVTSFGSNLKAGIQKTFHQICDFLSSVLGKSRASGAMTKIQDPEIRAWMEKAASEVPVSPSFSVSSLYDNRMVRPELSVKSGDTSEIMTTPGQSDYQDCLIELHKKIRTLFTDDTRSFPEKLTAMSKEINVVISYLKSPDSEWCHRLQRETAKGVLNEKI